ncbi:MAG: peptidase C13 [Alphaproteobacteria bacterium]|nr:peptidase C13 [Alphaproteobacteria bacterium]
MTRTLRSVCLAALSAALAFAAAAQTPAQRDPTAGVPPTAFAAGEVAWLPKEAARQQAMLAAALDKLAPQRPGVRDVYVLSAGLWSDPVFANEATKAGDILRKRYKADGRTVVLANTEPSAPLTIPAASPGAITAALGRIAQKMDPKEDVLLVFLTSHGDKNGVAVFENNRLRANLSPLALRAALDDTGVTNRIVIISACHGGVFIPALQSPTTVVATAASSEKTSFGCQPENEWTYFGDALFNQSMSRGRGLIQAFAEAKAYVSMWETRDRLIPSEPQLSVGAQAAPILAQIEK